MAPRRSSNSYMRLIASILAGSKRARWRRRAVKLIQYIVIARSEATKQSRSRCTRPLDCFAELVIGPATSGRTRWLAMTMKSARLRHEHGPTEMLDAEAEASPCQRERRADLRGRRHGGKGRRQVRKIAHVPDQHRALGA